MPGGRATGLRCLDHTIVVSLWQPGAKASTLVGLQYHPGQTPILTREWTSDAIADGVLAAPVASADGNTVYVTGRDRKLWALKTSDGKVKWSVPLDFLPQTPPSVSPDGLILLGGGPPTRTSSHSRTWAITARWPGAATMSLR